MPLKKHSINILYTQNNLSYFSLLKTALFLILYLAGNFVFSQIVDDSTKLIYGPKTTSYVLEDDFI